MVHTVGEGLNPFPWIFGSGRDAHKDASPLTHVHKGMPPHLLVTAGWEVPCLTGMAEEYESALKKNGCDVRYEYLDGCRHSTIVARRTDRGHDPLHLEPVAPHRLSAGARGRADGSRRA